MRNASDDESVDESEDSYFGDFIEDEAAESPINAATQEMVDQVLKTLTFPERVIIKLRYGLEDGHTYTAEEVGRRLKVTPKKIREIERRATTKLQSRNKRPPEPSA
jgi:RNA polymerase primary sigma factor